MKKFIFMLLILSSTFSFIFADNAKKVVVVWYPNESGADMKDSRQAYDDLVAKALGCTVEDKLTTDYTIAIESVANKNAGIGMYWGAQGYIDAHSRNPKVLPLVVNSGASGTLNDAVYYSWLCVKQGNEKQYVSGASYSIDSIKGKKISWVSTSSTSGFRVPTSFIVSYFAKRKMPDLKTDDLLEGGQNKFFSQVLFGNSHQGSAVNLLTDKADVAAFCDTELINYADLVLGKANTAGAVYQIKADAAEPFKAQNLAGQKFVIINSLPVLNQPFVINTDMFTKAEIAKLAAAFTSDETSNNPKIFLPADSKDKGMLRHKSGKEKFIAVEDSWFDPIRNMAK
jgi:phosphonate transport system substrate-binding protein